MNPRRAGGRREYKKSQRRVELDELRQAAKVFNIGPETFQVLLAPSDPDFPFAIPLLDFDLTVPQHYPHAAAGPTIHVNNDSFARAHAINIETAFDAYDGTLAARVRRLDAELERLLMLPPARTVTIVKTRHTKPIARAAPAGAGGDAREPIGEPTSEPASVPASTPPIAALSLAREDADAARDSDSDSDSDSEDYYPDVDAAYSSNEDSDAPSSGSESEDAYRHESDDEDIDSGVLRDFDKPRREGTELVFHDVEMTNMALLEIVSLNLLFQCGRCKHLNTLANLQSAEYGRASKPLATLCAQCDLPLLCAFRKEFLHSACHTAGYLDVDGGRPVDLLPSSYAAMCGQCQAQTPVMKSVDLGARRLIVCRHCHAKMWLRVELFAFNLLSTETIAAAARSASRARLGPAAPKQKLGLTGGEPLPQHGACEHYRKSARWFRFGCCQRVFPCDKCHDLEMQHPCEQATRMVCGYCSREQRFSAKCVYCEHDYTQRHTRFWEGGKGVRDRKLMSRKDKRKYKRDPVEHKKSDAHFQGKSKKITRD